MVWVNAHLGARAWINTDENLRVDAIYFRYALKSLISIPDRMRLAAYVQCGNKC